jgi:phytoene/squalene synthetase
MASNYEILHGTAATAHPTPASETMASQLLGGRKNSYSRKRRSTFDAWQEHVRKSAASVGVAFSARHDRDLRRAIISG